MHTERGTLVQVNHLEVPPKCNKKLYYNRSLYRIQYLLHKSPLPPRYSVGTFENKIVTVDVLTKRL